LEHCRPLSAGCTVTSLIQVMNTLHIPRRPEMLDHTRYSVYKTFVAMNTILLYFHQNLFSEILILNEILLLI